MKVIILSSHELERAAREGIESGAFANLAKSCNLEVLIDTTQKTIFEGR